MSIPFPSWLKPILSRKSILCAGLLGTSLAGFGQEQQDDSVLGSNPSLNVFQKRSIVPQGELSNPACDPSDPQSGDCDDSQAGRTGRGQPTNRPGAAAGNQLLRGAKATSGSSSREIEMENSQYLKVIDPPTEFQKFVESSIGEKLPIYGASLFDRVPSTYAPVDRVPVAPDYTIGPGDELDVRLWGQITTEQRLTVDRTGDVFIPQVGRVSVAGLRFCDLPTALKTSIGRVFRNFEVSVSMAQLRSIQVFVVGHARRPGTYTISALSTLVNALFVSGGPSPQGSMRNIELRRARAK